MASWLKLTQRRRKLPHQSFGLLFGLLVCWVLAARCTANAQAPLPVYTDRLVNAFQDWGWGTRVWNNSSPVYSGTNSVGVSGTAWNVALGLHLGGLDATTYASLSFWAHGGSTGGQILRAYAHVDGIDQPGTNLPALQANIWKQYVVPLGSLHADNKTTVDQFTLQLTSNGSTNTFYVDDIQLTSKPAPALVHVGVNVTDFAAARALYVAALAPLGIKSLMELEGVACGFGARTVVRCNRRSHAGVALNQDFHLRLVLDTEKEHGKQSTDQADQESPSHQHAVAEANGHKIAHTRRKGRRGFIAVAIFFHKIDLAFLTNHVRGTENVVGHERPDLGNQVLGHVQHIAGLEPHVLGEIP